MSGAIHDVMNGALVQEMRLNILSNNIANVSTVGFKEDRLFRTGETSEQQVKASDENPSAKEEPASLGGLPVGNYTNYSQGNLAHTGNRLDLSLDGDGFFCVEVQGEIQYTRKGNFTLDSDGVLVTQEGLPVMGKAGNIQLTSQNIVIDEEGNILDDGNPVDTVKVVEIPQTNALQKIGNTRFAVMDPKVEEQRAEETRVLQGFIEQSNVDAINAMAEMIDVLRGYESYQKVIQSLNDTTLKAINDVGRLA